MLTDTGIPVTGIDTSFDYLVYLFGPTLKRKDFSASHDYVTFADMLADFERRGTITVNTANSDNTIFATPELNACFRYWHDICHIKADADFSAEGERKAAALQMDMVRALVGPSYADKERWCAIIDAEVNGQIAYYMAHGDFPKDQRQFTVDYLESQGWRVDDFPHDISRLIIEY